MANAKPQALRFSHFSSGSRADDEMTNEQKYLDLALQLAAWFKGDNAAEAVMYDPQTGRGYDGINDTASINRNAGAESTIEALLTLQAIEKYIVEEDKQ